MTSLAVKVDVDTLRGYREGVPRMLSLFERRGLKASFFFSFGPDNSGKAIRRIFRKGFISKMLRTKAPSTYGLKTLLYGTLLPAPLIVEPAPGIFKRAFDDGHDCGIHAWDHVYTQDKLDGISEKEFLALYEKAAELFQRISGAKPMSYAAPGWQFSEASLAALDKLGLRYASDARGYAPFLPVLPGKSYRTLQIPTTLPTMDEVLGLPDVNDATLPGLWLNGLTKEWNVLTVHAEMEGISKLDVLEHFLEKAHGAGVTFLTLEEIAKRSAPLSCRVEKGTLEGRAGTLAVQGECENG